MILIIMIVFILIIITMTLIITHTVDSDFPDCLFSWYQAGHDGDNAHLWGHPTAFLWLGRQCHAKSTYDTKMRIYPYDDYFDNCDDDRNTKETWPQWCHKERRSFLRESQKEQLWGGERGRLSNLQLRWNDDGDDDDGDDRGDGGDF